MGGYAPPTRGSPEHREHGDDQHHHAQRPRGRPAGPGHSRQALAPARSGAPDTSTASSRRRLKACASSRSARLVTGGAPGRRRAGRWRRAVRGGSAARASASASSATRPARAVRGAGRTAAARAVSPTAPVAATTSARPSATATRRWRRPAAAWRLRPASATGPPVPTRLPSGAQRHDRRAPTRRRRRPGPEGRRDGADHHQQQPGGEGRDEQQVVRPPYGVRDGGPVGGASQSLADRRRRQAGDRGRQPGLEVAGRRPRRRERR